MGFNERMKRIQEHFSMVSVSEVEEKLIKAGIEYLSSSSQSNMVIATEQEIEVKYNYVSTVTNEIEFEGEYKTFAISFSPLYSEVA